ncbi:PEPxxWA-CTERM sorting domain-containing protein [uncultured Phenylobacterium sp.]|uniref:PEPxxWA-CTERM sorting domain-containing protein n=1 Tax=uncultured Phenylobacterium sp. TaxID=349273 RepID=UPI0025CD8A1F|nr:PEPxxWA-CTERM sorting domain-containing protein [uncultured Phenylobacterium sp.]
MAATPAAAVTVLDVGRSNDCGKTTCFNDQGAFTRTWSAVDVPGRTTIGKFLMDRGVLGDLDSRTFRVAFTVDGKEVGSWGAYTMGNIGGAVLGFDGLDFEWNPADGDLVLTLALVPLREAGAGGGGLFSGMASARFADDRPSQPGGVGFLPQGLAPPSSPIVDRLVAISAPEPATWALMIGGFGLAGAALRRSRRASA